MQFSVVAALLLLATSLVSAAYQPDLQTLQANDIHVLQYALILENLEYEFYRRFQELYSSQDFVNAGLNLTDADYTYFNLIRDHEQAHVQFLANAVPSPTSSCTYDFSSVTSVATYIGLAQILENTGVSAYDGAINNFYNPVFAQYAATIATIEARHASYLNRVNGQNPFPAATDTAENSTTISNIVFGGSSPLATCAFVEGFALPQLYIVYPVQNASDSSQPTPSTLAANDVLVLQYALFLEHFEAAFYNYVTSNFNANSFNDPQIFNYIQLISNHENAHVTALTQTIQSFGATPIRDCQYDFATAINNTASNVIAIAAALENTGVGAYDGAVNAINNPALKQYAATIATVEARHASYINYLNLAANSQGPVNGLNGPFDIAYNFSTVNGIVASTNLITSCPDMLQAFRVLIVQPYTNATFTHAVTTGSVSTTGSVIPTSTPTTATTRGTTTARTSGASIAFASVVVALLVAIAAL